jgi:hypothetical protein
MATAAQMRATVKQTSPTTSASALFSPKVTDNFFSVCIRNISNFQLNPESIATLPPFGPIEGQKWFDQISSQ